jgi:hypothetical protein
MLSEKMQEILMQQARFSNPTQDCEWDGFTGQLQRYERYSTFLDACGHDTQALAVAIAKIKTAVDELRRVQESCVVRFNENPFPFMANNAGGGAERAPTDQK